MADPENAQRPSLQPPRGPTMYAVEGMVLGICAMAWVYSPLRLALSPVPLLDEILVFPLGLAACLNLLLCTLEHSNESVQASFFALTLTVFLGYLFVSVEALTSSRYATVFFGGGFLFQIPAGISLGFLAVQTLLAAGAVSHRLWRLTQWQDGTLLLIPTLLCCLFLRERVHTEGVVVLLVLVALSAVSLFRASPTTRPWVFVYLGMYASLVFVSSVLAYTAGVTLWTHLTMTTLLWLLLVHKSVVADHPFEPLVPSAVVVADPPVPQSSSMNRRVFYVPPPIAPQPSSARIHGDAVLFGGRALLRADAPVKKHI